MHHAQGRCHREDSTFQARVRVFFSNRYPQPCQHCKVTPLIHSLSLCNEFISTFCLWSEELKSVVLNCEHAFLPFLDQSVRFENTRSLHGILFYKPMLICLTFHRNFYVKYLHTKLDVYSLIQILVPHFSANIIPRTRAPSFATWEATIHVVCSSSKRELGHVQTRLGTWACRPQYLSAMQRSFLKLN